MWPLLPGWWVLCGCFFRLQTQFCITIELIIAGVGMDIVLGPCELLRRIRLFLKGQLKEKKEEK